MFVFRQILVDADIIFFFVFVLFFGVSTRKTSSSSSSTITTTTTTTLFSFSLCKYIQYQLIYYIFIKYKYMECLLRSVVARYRFTRRSFPPT